MRALGLALAFWIAAAPVAAQRNLAIERFDAAITVNRDGTVDVAETITARFEGSWNGIYRTIPVEYHTPQGFNWTLRLDLVSATADGRALEVDRKRERHYVKYKIWVPGAEDATRTVVLRYRARNGLRFFEDHDELYWNVTGDEWDVPIGAAFARITLPAAASGVRAIAFNGAYGSTAQDARVTIQGARGRGRHAAAARIPRGTHRRRGLEQGTRRGADHQRSSPRLPGEQLAAPDSPGGAGDHVLDLAAGRAGSGAAADRGAV